MDINAILQSALQIPTQANDTGVSIAAIGAAFVIYIVVLWTAFSIWVFFDAKKRFNNLFVVTLVTVFVFVFNFPALILYLVVRPEDEHMVYPGAYNAGGVDVPVVKFVGENGEIKMALNLQISSQLYDQADMTLDLGVSGDRKDMKVLEAEDATHVKSDDVEKTPISSKLKNKLSGIKKKFKGKPKKSSSKSAKSEDNENKEVEEDSQEN